MQITVSRIDCFYLLQRVYPGKDFRSPMMGFGVNQFPVVLPSTEHTARRLHRPVLF